MFWLAAVLYVLKYSVPALAIAVMLRLPLRVAYPMHLHSQEMLLHGFGGMLMVSALTGALFIRHSADLERYRVLSDGSTDSDSRLVVYLLLSIFVLPLAAEILLHGPLFQVLRQFGDGFAAITVSLLAALLMHHAADGIRMGLVTLVLSYYLLRTGSFWAAACLRVVHEIFLFGLYCLGAFGEMYTLRWWLTLLIPFLIGAAIMLLAGRLAGNARRPGYRNRTYLRSYEKGYAMFTTLPMAAFVLVSMVLTVTTAMLG
ncbi:MAG: CPBP family intramembrane metalloprotease [Oscillospiraceae bacterium]|nr:CPBP family intramembrane metalloprotease [Oscillospiraceae bacterium]